MKLSPIADAVAARVRGFNWESLSDQEFWDQVRDIADFQTDGDLDTTQLDILTDMAVARARP